MANKHIHKTPSSLLLLKGNSGIIDEVMVYLSNNILKPTQLRVSGMILAILYIEQEKAEPIQAYL